MNDDSSPHADSGDEEPDLASEILRELNDVPLAPLPANATDDTLPFEPSQVSLATLLKYANAYRNNEPLLAPIMQEITNRDYSTHAAEVRALRLRWRYLVQISRTITWPDTAQAREESAFCGRHFEQRTDGMLGFFGYRVGMTQGLVMSRRHQILDYIYQGRLPVVNDDAYTQSWGEPFSAQRLKCLVSTIAGLVHKASGHEIKDYADAIAEWKADLAYLRSRYFRPLENPDHDWEWPVV